MLKIRSDVKDGSLELYMNDILDHFAKRPTLGLNLTSYLGALEKNCLTIFPYNMLSDNSFYREAYFYSE